MKQTKHFENDDGTCKTCIELGRKEALADVMKIIKEKIIYLESYKNAGFYKEASIRIKELKELKSKLQEQRK